MADDSDEEGDDHDRKEDECSNIRIDQQVRHDPNRFLD